MLHISHEEQRERLLERLTDPTKHWKYNPGDLEARAQWDDYQAAYAEALGQCSTDEAPWYVVPADRKWYRDWAVAHLLQETFADLDLDYPKPTFDVEAERKRLPESAGLTAGEQQLNEPHELRGRPMVCEQNSFLSIPPTATLNDPTRATP